eukprot:171015-Chlamydomonas_euryale.AAC.1
MCIRDRWVCGPAQRWGVREAGRGAFPPPLAMCGAFGEKLCAPPPHPNKAAQPPASCTAGMLGTCWQPCSLGAAGMLGT